MSARHTTMATTLDEAVSTTRFRVHERPHIVVHADACGDCPTRACTYVCPAGLFVLLGDGRILFNYEHCFECGTCYVACDKPDGAIEWSYPAGGHGVAFTNS